MQKVHALMGLTVLIALAGCMPEGGRFNLLRPTGVDPQPPPPTKEDLVNYLNNNSQRIPGIKSNDVSLTPSGSMGISLTAKLCAQGPRNFRMVGEVLGNQEIDLGSNPQEFWYWIPKADKHQVVCSYKALEEGNVKMMPFPFQPEWVLETMNMGRYGPAEKYEMNVEKDKLMLVERTKSAQGVPVKKIIVFNRKPVLNDNQPRVTDFLLVDERTGKTICSAKITRKQQLRVGPGAADTVEIPREMKLSWPEQNMELGMNLNGVTLVQPQQFPPQVFVRSTLRGVQTIDLATGRLEGVTQAGVKGAPH